MDHFLVVGQPERGVEFTQGNAPKHLFQVIEFCLLGTQKAPPCRGIEKQVAHGDGGATGMPRRRDRRRHVSTFDLDLPAFGFPFHVTGQGQSRDRADRRQRFTTKAQRANGFQIIQPANLAGSVTRQRQRQVIAFNAMTIVTHLEQLHAALLHIHIHGLRPRIEGVFQQFLEDRGGSLDHLTGSNLVGQAGIEQLDLGQNGPQVRGIFSTWPTMMRSPLILLAARIACSLTLYWRAISDSVSPG